eukprot:2940994-Pyramimonas_sp.AAC.1
MGCSANFVRGNVLGSCSAGLSSWIRALLGVLEPRSKRRAEEEEGSRGKEGDDWKEEVGGIGRRRRRI